MSASLRIARIAGIDITLHPTFFLILPLGALIWGSDHGVPGALFGVLMILLLFACVALHELGHALMARILGLPVRSIMLLPIGGLALLERAPRHPLQELLIALAGPLVNVLILFGLLIYAVLAGMFDGLLATGQLPSLSGLGVEVAVFWLMQANLALILFNMLPAFPLDGGRVLRSLVWMATDNARATRIATAVGQLLAVGIGLYAIVTVDLLLLMAAAFIFFGARGEQSEMQAQQTLSGLRVGDLVARDGAQLVVGDRIAAAAGLLLSSRQSDFAVLHGSRPIGLVSREAVLRAMAAGQGELFITLLMQREFVRVDTASTVEQARQLMAEHGARVAAAYDGEEYRGLLTVEAIVEAFTVGRVLQREQTPRPSVGGPEPAA